MQPTLSSKSPSAITPTSNKAAIAALLDQIEPPPARSWESFVPATVLKQWAAELKAATSNTENPNIWQLTGRAGMIINSNHSECRELRISTQPTH